MDQTEYLKILVEDIHSTTVATIGANGHPQTRVIDMMRLGQTTSPVISSMRAAFGCNALFFRLSPEMYLYFKNSGRYRQNRCLHCGRCVETCPKQVIKKRCSHESK